MGYTLNGVLPALAQVVAKQIPACRAKGRLIAFGLATFAASALCQNVTFLREFTLYSNPAGVAVDGTGVYTLRLTAQGPGNQVVSLLKYDTSGRELWTRPFINSPTSFAGGVAVTRDAIYVAGTGHSSPGNVFNWDIFVARFRTDGALMWTRQLELPRSDFARGVAADASGVYVIGQQERGGVIRKYDTGGVELWTVELSAPGDGYHAPLGIALDSTGAYVAGVIQPTGQGIVGFVRKYDANGARIWDRDFGFIARGVAVDDHGVYVVGSADSNSLRKYDTDGGEVWTRAFDRAMGLGIGSDLGVTVDSTGIYVVGGTFRVMPGNCSQGEQDAVALKFDHDGGELWTRQFGTHENDFARTAAVDANNVYVAGDRFLVKFEKTSEVPDASSPRISFGCVVNAASYLGGGVAPGEIVTIFGSGIGPAQSVTQRIGEDGRLATMLAGTRILFNGEPAPLLFVSDKQSSAVVPYAVAGLASVNVQVEYNGTRSENVTVPVLRARPGIFTRDGRQAVALNEDGSVNSPANPAISGSIITFFATGEGLTSPRVPDGLILGSTPPRPVSDVYMYFSVSEDDWPVAAEVLYSGGVSGSIAGLLQIQARVPRDVAPNDAMPVSIGVRFDKDISVAPYVTPAVTVAVR